jgi:type 1 glutamine amidotransferase
MNKRILFHVGGPDFHPVAGQATAIAEWLGDDYSYEQHDGEVAFDHLDDCDLLVLMGLHWTGMKQDYRPLHPRHKEAFEKYVASGRPLIAHHGAIASYDDWPRFGELVGFAWVWGTTTHSPVGDYTIEVLPTGHPIVKGMSDYRLTDELYYLVKLAEGFRPQVHAQVEWAGEKRPIISTGQGGRIAGAGKVAYLANGHDMRAFECPQLKTLWQNAVHWALAK